MNAMALDNDPVARLAALLDNIDASTRRTNISLQREQHNRLSILVVHGSAAIIIGPLFTAQTSHPGGMANPAFAALRHIPAAPWTLGILLTAGGVILLPATLVRHLAWETVGLILLGSWYATIAIGFLLPVAWWAAAGFKGPVPSLYPWGVYGHILTVLIVHLFTLRRMRRGDPA